MLHAELEALLFDHYCAGVAARRTGFDRDAFAFAYAALGAQRNTKIVGIFARLAKRDGKPGYLRHVPRLWRYLERDLAHPRLASLKRWYDRHLPTDARGAAYRLSEAHVHDRIGEMAAAGRDGARRRHGQAHAAAHRADIPKPMVRLKGRTLIDHVLDRIARRRRRPRRGQRPLLRRQAASRTSSSARSRKS